MHNDRIAEIPGESFVPNTDDRATIRSMTFHGDIATFGATGRILRYNFATKETLTTLSVRTQRAIEGLAENENFYFALIGGGGTSARTRNPRILTIRKSDRVKIYTTIIDTATSLETGGLFLDGDKLAIVIHSGTTTSVRLHTITESGSVSAEPYATNDQDLGTAYSVYSTGDNLTVIGKTNLNSDVLSAGDIANWKTATGATQFTNIRQIATPIKILIGAGVREVTIPATETTLDLQGWTADPILPPATGNIWKAKALKGENGHSKFAIEYGYNL